MNPKTTSVVSIILLIMVIIGAIVFIRGNKSSTPNTGDNTGNNTEDSGEVVSTTTAKKDIILELKINEKAWVDGVKITPLEVLEDSRCPVNVNCIQAGTVRLRATLESDLGTSSPQIFKLNTPITTEAQTIELMSVGPVKTAGKTIKPADYRFVFKITYTQANRPETLYKNPALGISFTIPKTDVLTENDAPNQHTIVLMREEDSAPRQNSEGPPVITVNIFTEKSGQSVESWLKTKDGANYGLMGRSATSTVIISGVQALTYDWSGLYEGKTIIFRYKDKIIEINSESIGSPDGQKDPILKDFEKIIGSLHLI